MNTRNQPITVTASVKDNLPETERECMKCEEATFVQDGYEIICPNCHFTPTKNHSVEKRRKTEWEKHRKQVDKRAKDSAAKRPRLIGGYKDAYWNTGEYSYLTDEHSFIC